MTLPSNCQFCGSPLAPTTRVCDACGQPVTGAREGEPPEGVSPQGPEQEPETVFTAPPEIPPVEPPPLPPSQPPTWQAPPIEKAPLLPVQPPRSNRTILIAVVVVVAFCCLFSCGIIAALTAYNFQTIAS